MRKDILLYADGGRRSLRSLRPDEANRLIAEGSAVWCEEFSPPRLLLVSRQTPGSQLLPGPDYVRPISLTKAQMETNALSQLFPRAYNAEGKDIGPARKYGKDSAGHSDSRILGNFVDYARTKVEQWPYVYNERTVSITPHGVCGLTVVQA